MSLSAFLSLPEELIDFVVCLLPTSDKASMLLVSHKLYRIAKPRIYEIIMLDRPNQLVKCLRFWYGNPGFARRCAQLTVDARCFPSGHPDLVHQNDRWIIPMISHSLKHLDNLQELHIALPFLWPVDFRRNSSVRAPRHLIILRKAYSEAINDLRSINQRQILSKLTSLSIFAEMRQEFRCTIPVLVVFGIPTLRRIELVNCHILEGVYWAEDAWIIPGDWSTRKTALEDIRFDNSVMDDLFISRVLEYPRALKKLAIVHSDLWDLRSAVYCSDGGPQLERALKMHRDSLGSLEMFGRMATPDGPAAGLRTDLDLRDMTALRVFKLFWHGSPPEARIMLGPNAQLISIDMATSTSSTPS